MNPNDDHEKSKRAKEKEQKELQEKLMKHYRATKIDLIKKGIDDIADNIQEYIEEEDEWNKGDFEL